MTSPAPDPIGLDELDRRIVLATQDGLPLVPRPYAAVAEQLCCSEEAVRERLAQMLESGRIRRIGAVPNHYAIGYTANGMSVWNIDDAMIERLVILNAPHPVPFARALAHDTAQIEASAYMNWLRRDGSEAKLAEEGFRRLEGFLTRFGGGEWFDESTRAAYHAAWSRPGALTGSVNWYRASPLHPATDTEAGATGLTLDPSAFVVKVPTLVLWGERDVALLPVLLDGLDEVVPDLRIVRLPEATHWLAHEAPAQVIDEIRSFIDGA